MLLLERPHHRVLQVCAPSVPHIKHELADHKSLPQLAEFLTKVTANDPRSGCPILFPDAGSHRSIPNKGSEICTRARAPILSRDAALDSRGDPVWILSAVTTSSGRRPIGCTPGRLEPRLRILDCVRSRSVAVRLYRSHVLAARVYVRVPRGRRRRRQRQRQRRRWRRWRRYSNVRNHFPNWSGAAPRGQIAATPTTRTIWTSRTGRGPGTASSDHRTHESTRCLASSVRFVQRPTRYYLSPLPICLSRSPYAPSIATAFAPSPSDRDLPARVGRRERGERELLSGSRSLNAAVTSRATILSKFAREKERRRLFAPLAA